MTFFVYWLMIMKDVYVRNAEIIMNKMNKYCKSVQLFSIPCDIENIYCINDTWIKNA